MSFEPTLETPAVQYFEGVDMNGMAMRAGLKPGDFLLEVSFLFLHPLELIRIDLDQWRGCKMCES